MAQVIRADLTLVPDPLADLGEGGPAPLRPSAATSRTSAKAQERQAFPPPAPVPAWARASGRAGHGDPLFFAGAGLALLDAFLRRDPPCAGALRAAPGASERRGLRQDPAPQRRRRRAARPALRRRRRLGPAAKLLRCGAISPAGRPASTPSRLAAAAARLDLAPPDPNGLASSLKACAGRGRSGLGRGQEPPPWRSPPSRTPQPPKPKSSPSGCSTSSIAIRLRWPRPVPLIATKILDPALRSHGGGRRPRPGDPAWPKARRRGDRARRRLGPRPRRRSCPPLRDPDRRRAQTARQTGGENCRPAARRGLRLARPRRRARRR